jgi:carbon monoxide dehydrogenase subunit G
VKVAGTFSFRGPRRVVWELLQDPEVLSKALPGAQRLARTTENRYEGVMKVGVGPLTAEFALSVTLADKVPPEHFTMHIDSKGGLGEDAADGGTRMTYSSELQIGGRVASVGQRVIDTAARSMTEKGLEALQRALDERLAGSKGTP